MLAYILGTESSLRDPVSRGLAVAAGTKSFKPDAVALARKNGLPWEVKGADPNAMISYLEDYVAAHSEMIEASRGRGLFSSTVFEPLAYFLTHCVDAVEGDVARSVYKNCIDFARANYSGRMFLMCLNNKNYCRTEVPFSGSLVREYQHELVIRGLLHRWGFDYVEIIVDDLEAGMSEVGIRLSLT